MKPRRAKNEFVRWFMEEYTGTVPADWTKADFILLYAAFEAGAHAEQKRILETINE